MSSALSNDPAESQEAVFRFLANPKTHGLSEPVLRVDTANAVVFLAGPDAYKVKRAVKFPFMDLSTLDKRRRACEAEIEVNRADAPDVYLAALPITRKGDTLEIGGKGEIVEWVTHMRRFDENATLDRVAERDGVSEARSSTSWRSRSAAPTPARRCGTRRGPRMPSRLTSSRMTPLSPSGPIFSMRRRPAGSPSIRGSLSRSCGRSSSSAARLVSRAAVMAICTCATLSCSTASRLCSMRSSFPTRSRAATCSTILPFC